MINRTVSLLMMKVQAHCLNIGIAHVKYFPLRNTNDEMKIERILENPENTILQNGLRMSIYKKRKHKLYFVKRTVQDRGISKERWGRIDHRSRK